MSTLYGRVLTSSAYSPLTHFLILLIYFCCGLQARVLPEIYWNSSNPIFKSDGHVFVVKIHDRLDFVCPYYETSTPTDVEVMEIYSVTEMGHDLCTLTADSVLAGVCNNPYQRTYATIVFREYTPKPGGLEFKPGRTYHFISTSTSRADGLQNRKGGLCKTKNMKVKFEVEPLDIPDVLAGLDNSDRAIETELYSKGDTEDYDEEEGDRTMAVSDGGSTMGNTSQSAPVTTPQFYEIHTRPPGDGMEQIGPDYDKQYGTNSHQRRNGGATISNWWHTVLLSSILLFINS